MNGLIVTKTVMEITIVLSLLKAVVVAGYTKKFRDIRGKEEEMDADTTLDVVDVYLVVETTKVPLVTRVDPNNKAIITVAKITMAIIKTMATTANIITVVILVTMVINSTRVPIKIRIRGRTKVPLTQVENKVITTSVIEEMISTISV